MNTSPALSDLLHAARRSGMQPEVNSEHGLTYHDALDVQLDVLRRFVDEGETLAGWKVGLSTGKSRDALGENFRPFGYIRGPNCLSSGASIALGAIHDCRVEPELCVVMGARLEGEVTPQQARAAVRAIAPAFEVNSVRVGMREDPSLFLADGLANWGIVVGPEQPVPPGDIAMQVSLLRDGVAIARSAADMAADGPFVALARLSAILHTHGRCLEEGQNVITGAFCQDRVTQAASYRAEFDGLGAVEVRFI